MFKTISVTSDCHRRQQHLKSAGGTCKMPLAAALVVAALVSLAIVQLTEAALSPANPLKLAINVPKSPTLIAGLNQQFKSRQNASNNSASLSGVIGSRVSIFGANWAKQQQQQQQQQQSVSNGSPSSGSSSSSSSLYLDRHQQQLLAANPTIETTNLLTRSDGPAHPLLSSSSSSSSMIDQHNELNYERQQQDGLVQRLLNPPSATNYNSNNPNQLAQQSNGPSGSATMSKEQSAAAAAGVATASAANQQQHSYRGYSLIELEVKSEQDRRYVQDLYGNLSAALNEQAQRPQSISVSPYVDIDFWSFKSALNDQIDIMVSPKSRAFILGQLSRARIKHRIKIDDIQARMDQQQQQQQQSSPSSSPSAQSIGNSAFQATATSSLSGAKKNSNELTGRHDQFTSFKPNREADGAVAPVKLYDPIAMTSASGFVNDSLFFENYQRLADINQYLESIVARARDIARVQVIGRSSQGRYLRVLRLGYEQQDADGTTGPLQGSNSLSSSPLSSAPPNSIDDSSSDQTAGGGGGGGGANAPSDEQQPRSSGGQLDQQPPVMPNASSIVDQFFKRQQSVKKVGSLWLDGGTHAREWISPATVLYMSFRLSDNHAKCLRFFDHLRMVVTQGSHQLSGRFADPRAPNSVDSELISGINEINTSLLGGNGQLKPLKPRARTELEQKLELLAKRPQEVASEHACDLDLEQLLRKYTFYIMPVLNPDGYEYSHTHNRLWRKTRSTSNHPIYRHFCLGADPNRNYDARHGSTGSSSHPCSQTYGGLTPFTEPETRHQSNFVYAHRNALKMFISFHSYSQMILLPFSHSKQLAPDHKDLESVGQAAVRAIERTHGTQYKVGPSASILYTASGTASDWAYEKAGIKYSYTIELRDTGTFGFLLPRQQIVPTGEETFNGLLAMIAQMELNDNLLTPKSTLNNRLLPFGPKGALSNETLNADTGLVHAPDMDQLRPFGRFRPRPAQLENALDGSETWATPEPRPPGVRNRAPLSPKQASPDTAYLELDSNNHGIIEDEVVSVPGEEEPDAGLAFEGEGELMEPTNNLSVNSALSGQSSDAASQSAAKLMGHIYAHSTTGDNHSQLLGRQLSSSSNVGQARQRMISNQQHQMMGLSANGRSLINSPPGPARDAPIVPKRESSSDQTE